MKYRFQYIGQGKPGTICEFDRWDVKDMAKNSHDWKPHPDDADAIREVLLATMMPEIQQNELGRIPDPETTLHLPKKNGNDSTDHRK